MAESNIPHSLRSPIKTHLGPSHQDSETSPASESDPIGKYVRNC